ncbi:VOC family protein [Tropicimonas sp. IMCC34043]|uniref:bleomycin resistance protein n=1 Tax=Tropicimonas sp. IMCC34043 TaxID=2248760 RepID=UPI000E275DC6|nr:VOC family protein [Tropicimonas sp. IMCC34043]
MLEKLSPILPSRDIDATEAFYARLGFATVFKAADSYLVTKRDAAELHFFLSPGTLPATNDHGAFLRPSDVDAFSAEVAALALPAKGVPRFQPAEDKPWGMRECALIDHDGNLIRAAQEIADG